MMKERNYRSEQKIDLTNQVKNVIPKVLIAEYNLRHKRNPRGIYKEIKKFIEEEINTL